MSKLGTGTPELKNTMQHAPKIKGSKPAMVSTTARKGSFFISGRSASSARFPASDRLTEKPNTMPLGNNMETAESMFREAR
ncbi:hypothetical protein AA0482_1784 [Acetobacter cibinongensis NRIC 0482]|nr:hypothetical protein AA0482_1784 [Acetobacter cibinongensis NRIC 0482]